MEKQAIITTTITNRQNEPCTRARRHPARFQPAGRTNTDPNERARKTIAMGGRNTQAENFDISATPIQQPATPLLRTVGVRNQRYK